VTGGVRIAELLASEVEGLRALSALSVADADPDVEATVEGALAYRLERDGDPVASVWVHPDRAHVEFRAGRTVAADAAREAGLRVRPAATDPPRTLVFVEDGGEVKRAVEVLTAVVGRGERTDDGRG
jgi:hypothetical protein